MLTADLKMRLEGIEDASRKGYPIRNLYRLMYDKDLWMEAYANIQGNAGATTKGVDDTTLDGFSHARVDRLVQQLREGTYRPRPVRRTYIPKSNGKVRPLGIPNGDDKLVQEVARIILERAYEPVFSEASHGFRKGRSCHTALSTVGSRWNGTKWVVDVDVSGFFDNIDHGTLLELLHHKVHDRRFVALIASMLTAGYVEDWKYHGTYSGTPQGGVISPLLANIYLHELDRFIEGLRESFDSGKTRRWNPEYQHHRYKVHKYRKQIDALKDDPSQRAEVARLREEVEKHGEAMRGIPSQDTADPDFKRLRYVRYADDFIIGVIGSKADAEHILRQVKNFLHQELHLEVSEEKTAIRHIEDGCRFLGYQIREVRRAKGEKVVKQKLHGRHTKWRTLPGVVKLYVPEDVPASFCHEHKYGNYSQMESKHRTALVAHSIPEIISTYNAELRGLAEYYALASNVKAGLSKLLYIANHSLYKTVANKLRVQSMARVVSMLRQDDGEMVFYYEVGGKKHGMRVYMLKHLDRKGRDWQVDNKPNTLVFRDRRTELVERLNADKCEFCGSGGPCEVHHVRKLKDLKEKRHLTPLDRTMIARSRKTMVLCTDCHDAVHKGTLRDVRVA